MGARNKVHINGASTPRTDGNKASDKTPNLKQEKLQNGADPSDDTGNRKPSVASRMNALLKRYAFVISLTLHTLTESLKQSARGQYRYRYFHSTYEDELSHYNVTSGCGVEQVPEVQAIENEITKTSERWRMYELFVTTGPIVVMTFVLGMKSDQVGRRFLFFLPTLGSAFECATWAVVINFKLHVGYSMIGSFVYCMTSADYGIYLASISLVSDTHGKEDKSSNSQESGGEATKAGGGKSPTARDGETEQKSLGPDKDDDLDASRETHRTFKFVLLDVTQMCTRAAMMFATGYIIQYAGFFYSMILVLGSKVFLFAFAFAFVTETGKQRKSVDFLGPARIIAKAAKHPHKRITIILVNVALLFALFSYGDEYGVLRTYQMSPPFCFTSVQLGWFNCLDYMRMVLTIPLLAIWRRLHLSDAAIATVGMISTGCSTLMLALIREAWVFLVEPFLAMPGDLAMSMTRIITSRMIGHSALASALGLVFSVQTIAWFVANVSGSYVYQYSLNTVPTAPFFMSTGFFALAAILFGAEAIHWRRVARYFEDPAVEKHVQKESQDSELTRL